MKTMFVTHESSGKKRFQKPNILRRKPKAPSRVNIAIDNESGVIPLVTKALASDQIATSTMVMSKATPKPIKNPVQRLMMDNNIMEDENCLSELYEINSLDVPQNCEFESNVVINNNQENLSHTSINVESFLNNSVSIQSITQIDVENDYSKAKEDWCIDFINNSQEIIIEDIDGSQLGSLRVAATPTVAALPLSAVSPEQGAPDTTTQPVQNLTFEYLASSSLTFKCDAPNCNKKFRSEEKLNKHKVVHEKNAKIMLLECPVKKKSTDGVDESCGRFCNTKEALVMHLNEEHNPEDAMFICMECGRRFFWASGLRAHARSHCRRAPLACGWPGCGRAFRQPCRLREHMRAHTGDKPYPCLYPNCGWSFRTASKLMRHARRHTGERRHGCGQCARAFRRREHLRDHISRYHSCKHPCTHDGCSKMFSTIESLKNHLKKVHKDFSETKVEAVGKAEEYLTPAVPDSEPKQTFMVSLESPALDASVSMESETEAIAAAAEVEARAEAEAGAAAAGGRCARTHCTWPLPPRAAPAPPLPPPAPPAPPADQYVLEEDVQIELSEGSESNIYTIRSDLFLHGNVLHNEDSEQLAGAQSSLLVVPPDDLMDTHPTIDLMQEELMYTDSAVDESSFRVFLLSGEDLS